MGSTLSAMGLEQEIREELERAVAATPVAREAFIVGSRTLEPMEVLEGLLLPMFVAQRNAILRLAREIEQLT